jgi:hypothetical protein
VAPIGQAHLLEGQRGRVRERACAGPGGSNGLGRGEAGLICVFLFPLNLTRSSVFISLDRAR